MRPTSANTPGARPLLPMRAQASRSRSRSWGAGIVATAVSEYNYLLTGQLLTLQRVAPGPNRATRTWGERGG